MIAERGANRKRDRDFGRLLETASSAILRRGEFWHNLSHTDGCRYDWDRVCRSKDQNLTRYNFFLTTELIRKFVPKT